MKTFEFVSYAPIRETTKAYGFDADGYIEWMPKSQVNIYNVTREVAKGLDREHDFNIGLLDGCVLVIVPSWLAYKNGYYKELDVYRFRR